MEPVSPVLILCVAAFLGLLSGLLGGMGGRKLWQRSVVRYVDELAADLAAYSERLKSAEGRVAQKLREKAPPGGGDPVAIAQLKQLLAQRAAGAAHPPQLVQRPPPEDDENARDAAAVAHFKRQGG